MISLKHVITTSLLLTFFPLSTAFAEQAPLSEQPINASATPDTSHMLAITFSPVLLLNPVFELTAEYKAMPKLGVALIAGYGSQTLEMNQKDYKFSLWEIGAQARYYLLGDFNHGMQLGAEVLHVNIPEKTYTDGIYELTAYGTRLELGAFLGYKIATNIGFTFEAQAGVTTIPLMATKPQINSTNAASDDIDTIRPLININLGWSF